MKVPLNWLKQYIDYKISQDELVAGLTNIGHMQDKPPAVVAGDVVLDLEVRQNRSDVLSMWGVAREVAAITDGELQIPSSREHVAPTNEAELKITNNAPDLCPRFKAYKIVSTNNQVTTPDYIKLALEAYGVNLISPIVDITNYVMLECGEPLHAFDSDCVPGGELVVRRAVVGETLPILGGKTLTFTQDDLIVAGRDGCPLSYSGLVGGATSGISSETKDVILEAATYNQAAIRRGSLRHSVRTEASTRHEKFLHPRLVDVALNRAIDLILQICGGRLACMAESYPAPCASLELAVSKREISRLSSLDLTIDYISQTLEKLGFRVVSKDDEDVTVEVPYWRTDIDCEADLVEEVVRIYGYHNIPSSAPAFAAPLSITSAHFVQTQKIKNLMVVLGFTEQITEPILSIEEVQKCALPEGYEPVLLQNSLNADKSALRPVMGRVLSHAVTHMQKFGERNIKLFEIGKTYLHRVGAVDHGSYIETSNLCFIIADAKTQDPNISYMEAKGVVEAVLSLFGVGVQDAKYKILVYPDRTTTTLELGFVARHNTQNASNFKSPQAQVEFDINVKYTSKTPFGDIIAKIKTSLGDNFQVTLIGAPYDNGTSELSALLHFMIPEGQMSKEAAIAAAEAAVAKAMV